VLPDPEAVKEARRRRRPPPAPSIDQLSWSADDQRWVVAVRVLCQRVWGLMGSFIGGSHGARDYCSSSLYKLYDVLLSKGELPLLHRRPPPEPGTLSQTPCQPFSLPHTRAPKHAPCAGCWFPSPISASACWPCPAPASCSTWPSTPVSRRLAWWQQQPAAWAGCTAAVGLPRAAPRHAGFSCPAACHPPLRAVDARDLAPPPRPPLPPFPTSCAPWPLPAPQTTSTSWNATPKTPPSPSPPPTTARCKCGTHGPAPCSRSLAGGLPLAACGGLGGGGGGRGTGRRRARAEGHRAQPGMLAAPGFARRPQQPASAGTQILAARLPDVVLRALPRLQPPHAPRRTQLARRHPLCRRALGSRRRFHHCHGCAYSAAQPCHLFIFSRADKWGGEGGAGRPEASVS
jgi:hypothetical protein